MTAGATVRCSPRTALSRTRFRIPAMRPTLVRMLSRTMSQIRANAMLARFLVIGWLMAHRQMRTISCLIWILITLLITATLDRAPDPPAANPAGTQLTISGQHELPPAFGAPARSLAPSQMHEPEHLAVLDNSEPLKPNNSIDLLERGTDTSPPLLIS